ncbi:MAG: DUF971 domain-containing protein [Planctomycetaceae bacterium]|jgi:DUF971 family protein
MKTPQNIRVHRDDGVLEIVWTEDEISRLPFRLLRQSCRCAVCIDEFTGRQLLKPDSIPEDIQLNDISLTGNYAVKIVWSDTHDSGLYTWTHLHSLDE